MRHQYPHFIGEVGVWFHRGLMTRFLSSIDAIDNQVHASKPSGRALSYDGVICRRVVPAVLLFVQTRTLAC
jgi:hypothetical protein